MKKQITLMICLMISLGVHSQSWRADADSLIVKQLFADQIGAVDIYAFNELLSASDTVFSIDRDTILVPFSVCCGYFIDLHPSAGWAHPCKYCFVNSSNEYAIYSAEMPPLQYNNTSPLSLKPRSQPLTSPIVFDTEIQREQVGGDHEHQWAVLICGEHQSNGSPQRFWFDLSCVYTVLTEKYGFQEAYYDTETTPRHIIVSAPNEIVEYYNYGMSNAGCGDLNGNDSYAGDFFNYQNEQITQHNKSNIEDIFGCFAGDNVCIEKYSEYELRELNEKDQLFIYITGHGRQDGDGRCYIPINTGNSHDNQRIYDDELVEMLRGIKCSQITLMMQTCHSGGFVEKFLEDISDGRCLCKNRIGYSASSADGVSHNDCYGITWDRNGRDLNSYWVGEFTYYWTAAALGYYPVFHITEVSAHDSVDIGPWSVPLYGRGVGDNSMNWSAYFGNYEYTHPHTRYDVNPDVDNDGSLAFSELFAFADSLDTWSPNGYYHPLSSDPEDTIEYPQQLYESTFTKEAATLAGYQGQIDGIVNSGTATQPYRLCGDIWVSPYSELTMWDEVHSPENVRVYVKPRGKLVLDGATLSNLPEQQSPMWKGVQVWGVSDLNQHKENGGYCQGFLEMKNGAEIRNAIIGIDVWKPDDNSSTGGIVKAYNSRFDNNGMAVYFHPYENHHEYPPHSGNIEIANNISSFKNCEFTIDRDYIGPKEFEMHASLYGVRGVGFYGCDFRFVCNNYSTQEPIGIMAWDAGFKVDGICTSPQNIYPCQTFDNSHFIGFHKAIYSVNDGSVGIRPATILNTRFSNNSFGIVTLKSGYATVLNSRFSVGQSNSLCSAGIYAELTPGFAIEQDTFSAPNRYIENYGIVIKDSKSQSQIYNNVFVNLYCANLSIGRNNTWMMPRSTTEARADILGLEYRCNKNANNVCDFYVLGGTHYYQLGIQNNQGTVNVPANNIFTRNSRFQFENHGNYGINYYYNPNLSDGLPTHTTGVTFTPTNDTVGCPCRYDLNGNILNDSLTPVLPDPQRLQREADYYNAYNTYITLRDIYDGLIDGGDTEGEISDIRSATPSDMWALRSQLLGHSPYLTKNVLTSVADKNDVFPQSVLFEILASNPDELKNDSLIGYLQSMDNPLPDYMIGLLRQVANGVTARTAMESQMARFSQEYRLAADDLIRSILCDTVVDKEALIGWLGNKYDLESDREIVSMYMEDGRFNDAMALASMFPSLYCLTGNDLAEHNDYMDLLNMFRVMHIEQRNTMQIDSIERLLVEHLADYSTGTPQAMAKAIMTGAYRHQYDNCPSGLELSSSKNGFDPTDQPVTGEDLNKAIGFSVIVSPNPASTWMAVDYILPVGFDNAQMRIVNALGVTVATYNLSGKESQKVIDLRDLAAGVYTYSVFCGKYSNNGKIVIVGY